MPNFYFLIAIKYFISIINDKNLSYFVTIDMNFDFSHLLFD